MRSPFLFVVLVAACDLLEANTHIRHGELYKSGQQKYDDYFAQVHDIQVEAANIEDDARAAKKPIVTALKLTMESDDETIVAEGHDRVNAAASTYGGSSLDVQGEDVHFLSGNGVRGDADTQTLAAGIEQTARAEVLLAKKLGELPPRIDALRTTGKELEPHVREDFLKDGPPKISEVRQEMISSLDALDDAENKVNRIIKRSQGLVAKLQTACAVGSPPSSGSFPAETPDAGAPPAAGEADAAPPAPVATPVATVRKPPPQAYVPPSRPASPPPPPSPPAPTSTGEVFNP